MPRRRALNTGTAALMSQADVWCNAERVVPRVHGYALLRNSQFNKEMAFSLRERQILGIHGLLPSAFMTQEQQVVRVMMNLRKAPDDLTRYIQLEALQEKDEKLFYRVLNDHLDELMPIVYTPTVGLACQEFGHIFRYPKGAYITINDNSVSKIYQILSNWKSQDVKAIVVTDGERILGLGDLGSHGIDIPVGKLALYVALAGIHPRNCLPIQLDVGTDNEQLLADPFYMGLRRKRVRGEEYDRLIDNFIIACRKKFNHVLIQFEDFGGGNAFRLVQKYQRDFCVFDDDIQGTGAVGLAGMLACMRLLDTALASTRLLFFGAGQANLGIAELCVQQMVSDGLSKAEAHSRIYLMDSKGLITTARKVHQNARHLPFAKDMPESNELLEVIRTVRPNALIGASTVQGAFSEQVLRLMAALNERPIVFALSNPTCRSECTAQQAYSLTDGKVLFASGSPFPPLQLDGRLYRPGQANNAHIFPGVGLGSVLFQIYPIDAELFRIAAQTVAESITQESLEAGSIYPPLDQIREVSVRIAVRIGEYCYEKGTARLHPEPRDKELFVRSQMYQPDYDDLLAETYDWPAQDMRHGFHIEPDTSFGDDYN